MKIKISFPAIILLIFGIIYFSSCKKYLDARTDKRLVVPLTLQDAQALLDNYPAMNGFYSIIGSVSDDDIYVTDAFYNSVNSTIQNNYTWAKEAINETDWNSLYANVMSANVALETIQKLTGKNDDLQRIKGSALFYRSYAFYYLLQYYAEPYDRSVATQKPGIPIRVSADVDEKIQRASMEESYLKVIGDLTEAASLLPVVNLPLSRPSKAACYAMLARVYLTIENYTQAGLYADSSLQINQNLLNYNTLSPTATAPFPRFNTEDIFHSTLSTGSPLSVTNYRIDTILYQSYAANDLRKVLFFKTNGTGAGAYYTFKGSYDGTTSGNLFNGLAVDEMYLIRAECNARSGKTTEALNDLNTLLIKRWKNGTFIPYAAATPDEALGKILAERRKELVGRGIRWFDLRRLNKDSRFAKTLIRKIGGNVFQLPPNDPRFTFYIPKIVIDITGMQQNVR
jgi:tetratricopeptide (TPR) repeat protein